MLTSFSENDPPLSIIHEYNISTKSSVIYSILILSAIVVFACLPFIKVPISVKCNGVIAQGTPGYHTKLEAYCYMRPSDIDMIRIGQKVSLQVDAFENNARGSLSGQVLEISNELTLLANDIAVFRIRCSLDKDYFNLKGSRIYFRKGMNLTARFKIGDRNVFQVFAHRSKELMNAHFN